MLAKGESEVSLQHLCQQFEALAVGGVGYLGGHGAAQSADQVNELQVMGMQAGKCR